MLGPSFFVKIKTSDGSQRWGVAFSIALYRKSREICRLQADFETKTILTIRFLYDLPKYLPILRYRVRYLGAWVV